MPVHAQLARAEARDQAPVRFAPVARPGPLTQLARDLNARPANRALEGLSAQMTQAAAHTAPLLQRMANDHETEVDASGGTVQMQAPSALTPLRNVLMSGTAPVQRAWSDYIPGRGKGSLLAGGLLGAGLALSGAVSIPTALLLGAGGAAAAYYFGGGKKERDKLDFSGFNPDLIDDKEIPSNEQVFKLNRSGSMDFSKLFEEQYGMSTEEARGMSVKMTTKDTGNSYTTSGAGRFMTMKDPQLGHTRYKEFLKTLPKQIGKSEAETADLLLTSLIDPPKYSLKSQLLSSTSKLALEQTTMLFNNEIIHRSSSNLPTIVGVLQNVASGNKGSLAGALTESAMFVPTGSDYKSKVGGQQLSRLHHEGSKAREKLESHELEDELVDLHKSYKKSIGGVAKQKGVTVPELKPDISYLNETYMKSLSSRVDVKKNIK